MRTKISLSGDKEELVAMYQGYELLHEARVSGGVEYAFVMPKASPASTMAAADSLTKQAREKFGERRVGGSYITHIEGRVVFVIILGTNLIAVK